ncbi:TVP38/TMEM64 family protein [Pseudothauera rhizosphaerae]|uniref:TVP38/TMEM64 family membrane protein n=1 Tax=Pseudothauera rhizosphaerae TaxID=2565932 RepID=A0A4S4AVR5_9RHOO|nr:TVP38/TMEM64 family protein [Pseudothauera rhizosphaerae]THF62646.1 TVP38/TMEM64 family protein [Pseudothauera rhizosphaerae]
MKINVSRKSTYITLGAIVLAVAAYFSISQVREAVQVVIGILSVREPQEAIQAFRDYLLGFGYWAPAVSSLLMVFQSVIAPLPAFVVTFTNGLLFGWVWGTVLSWSSAMLGAALCFWIARALGRPVVERLVGGTRALEVSDVFFARYGNRAILISRLLPFVSFDIISYGAGLTPVSFWKFLVATGIGQLPATVIYSYLGQNLTGSVQVLFWVFSITAAIFVLGWTIGPVVVRRIRNGRNCACVPAGEETGAA